MELNDLPVGQVMVEAMQKGVVCDLRYRNSQGVVEDKMVEVHAVGLSSKGEPCARVFQVGGGAAFSEAVGWKMLSLKGVELVHLLPGVISQGPRPGYSPGDKGMGTIFEEISHEPVPSA